MRNDKPQRKHRRNLPMPKPLVIALLLLIMLGCSKPTRDCYDLIPQFGVEVVHAKSHTENATLFEHSGSEGYFGVNAALGSREVSIYVSIDATAYNRARLYDAADEYPYLDCSDALVTIDGDQVRPSNKGACANGVSREQMPKMQVMMVYFELPRVAKNKLRITLPQLRKKDSRRQPVLTVDYEAKPFPVASGGFR
jgi:hypothetical protein